MQIVKAVILFLLIFISLPDECQSASPAEMGVMWEADGALVAGRQSHDLLDSFIFLLFTTVENVTEDYSHSSYNKNSFVRLFVFPGYGKVYLPSYATDMYALRPPSSGRPDGITYYVYSLRKIVI